MEVNYVNYDKRAKFVISQYLDKGIDYSTCTLYKSNRVSGKYFCFDNLGYFYVVSFDRVDESDGVGTYIVSTERVTDDGNYDYDFAERKFETDEEAEHFFQDTIKDTFKLWGGSQVSLGELPYFTGEDIDELEEFGYV